MELEFIVSVRSVYGRDLVYPVCPNARKFADLLMVKTFNPQQLAIIRSLGYKVEVEATKLAV